jgi:hypothetical protein
MKSPRLRMFRDNRHTQSRVSTTRSRHRGSQPIRLPDRCSRRALIFQRFGPFWDYQTSSSLRDCNSRGVSKRFCHTSFAVLRRITKSRVSDPSPRMAGFQRSGRYNVHSFWVCAISKGIQFAFQRSCQLISRCGVENRSGFHGNEGKHGAAAIVPFKQQLAGSESIPGRSHSTIKNEVVGSGNHCRTAN